MDIDLLEVGAKLGYLKYVWWYVYSILVYYGKVNGSVEAISRIRERIHRIPQGDVRIIHDYFVDRKFVGYFAGSNFAVIEGYLAKNGW